MAVFVNTGRRLLTAWKQIQAEYPGWEYKGGSGPDPDESITLTERGVKVRVRSAATGSIRLSPRWSRCPIT